MINYTIQIFSSIDTCRSKVVIQIPSVNISPKLKRRCDVLEMVCHCYGSFCFGTQCRAKCLIFFLVFLFPIPIACLKRKKVELTDGQVRTTCHALEPKSIREKQVWVLFCICPLSHFYVNKIYISSFTITIASKIYIYICSISLYSHHPRFNLLLILVLKKIF